MRITDYLADQQVAFEEMVHPPAFTAQKLAHFVHVSGRQVAKSVLLHGPAGYLLAVLPATHHIDLETLGRELGGPVTIATDDELARLFLDCERGAMAPFGRLYGLTTLLDNSLDADSWIVFESQRHFLAIRMICRDFERLEQPRRLSFARAG